MSLVIAGGLVITGTNSGGGVINANNPLIGYRSLVTAFNLSSTSAAAGFPVSNLATPSTNLRWVGVVSAPAQTEVVTVNLQAADDVDYLGIARHNLYSAQIPVSVDYLQPGSTPQVWTQLVAPTLLPDDGPVLFRLPPAPYEALRLRLQPGLAAPTIAVLYAGAALVLQRRIYVGHTPMPMGRQSKVVNGRSEAGDFLGRIVLAEATQTQISLQNLTPAWLRTHLKPFIDAARETPFFFAWRPADYPREVGFAWLTDDPKPVNQLGNGMMSASFDLMGIT
jgi:hypothetical protein